MTTSSIEPLEPAATSANQRYKDELLDHEYDGIREYDNPLPRWWVMLFWASIVYSFGYAVHYHFSGRGESVAEEYEAEMRVAREERLAQALKERPSEAGLAQMSSDPALMQDAKLTFAERCVICHAPEGQGLIGPNLTDDHWIHGKGTLMDIYEVVAKGVPTKGMPPWELQLSPAEMRKVVAFAGTLRGKNLPGKPAEGTRVEAP